LLSACLGLLVVLLLIALWDYRRDQTFFFHESLLVDFARTTELGARNAIGSLGATVSVLLFNFAGLGAFFIPMCLGVAAGCVLFQRAHTLFPWKFSLMTVGFLALVILLALFAPDFDDPAGVLATLGVMDYVPKGLGGSIGGFLHREVASTVFGGIGTGILCSLLYAFCLYGLFVDDPRKSIVAGIHGLRERWERHRMLRRQRAEELREFRRQRAETIADGQQKLQPGGGVAAASVVESAIEGGGGVGDVSTGEERPEKAGVGNVVRGLDPPAPMELPDVPVERAAPSAGRRGGVGAAKLTILGEETVERATGTFEPKKKGDYQFPPVALLREPPPQEALPQENYEERASRLAATLGEFKIKVALGEIQTGPVITRYEVIPAPGVRVEKISGLANNIAMNLKAESVRVLAPVPGKGTVGIEVPNNKPKAVSLREIIESKAWDENRCEIPVVLGKDVTGKPMIADLARMPHCLIAGSTGSGKSVCINGIVASLVYHAGPDDIRFIMVDPKVVELQIYNKLPHMLIPVVTDAKKVPGALKWLISEMERRYQIFARTGVKNIAGFNAKITKDRAEAERARQMDLELSPQERTASALVEVPRDDVMEIPDRKLPYIVCFIDELADLMMVAPADIETAIARLAQLARAAGIHLILATQRPSVNVITGIIKANLPCRIAFKVTSLIDSRTILDQKGAESLIGRGDMLFIPPGSAHLVRAQGAFVSEDEINALVDHIALCNGEPDFDDAVQEIIETATLDGDGDSAPTEGTDDPSEDPLIAKSWEIIRSTKRASTSMLQRRLSIGYNRAARIMDILQERGYVGPENGPSPREILRDE
jgi:S-DNA-T family DNA segregation ATPase FtsK/SpoIIIE